MSLAPPWALDMLREARVARLGTADREGQPLVVPVCFAFDGRDCYSAVDPKPKRTRQLRRLRNIEVNPRVSLTVDRYDEEWTRLAWVIVEGRADVLTGGPLFARAADLLIAKYRQYEALGLDRTSGTMIRIVPDRILHWQWDEPQADAGAALRP